jgi:phospholipid/cholesterol/gamma-HCH transport system permease protein
LLRPGRIRLNALFHHIGQVGLNALPILGLLAFMIGVVIGFQGAEQLRKVGVDSLVVHLIGISVLREIGSLITAIIVAGRSGSAFTAQIGTMKVNQEIDASRAIGLDPMEMLVIPRILALMVAMPLLTFFANAMALLGGAVITYAMFDINLIEFLMEMRVPLDIYDTSVGLLKTPAFALVIAMVGCHEGLQVSGNAESVGLHTTRSVVESIFLVMVLNALFSVLFTAFGI